ncbi:MBL fold metallo-hydrolase [Candidatus Bipolaricaulota bacterium]|nr:MBL fold metallo-hydrolase [Candidatus Bipolaricaulota bacterium]
MSYNAYLVVGEKIALIDGAKAPFAGELLRNISEVVPPEKIDYLVVNHMEPDHSGSLPQLRRAAPHHDPRHPKRPAHARPVLRDHRGGAGGVRRGVARSRRKDLEVLPHPLRALAGDHGHLRGDPEGALFLRCLRGVPGPGRGVVRR